MIKDFVSVIIPTYNRAQLIKRSAESVLNQTYTNLELIIVDDGSTDNTEEIVKSIDDERIIYIKQSNKGACSARNNGIEHANGEFIAFQDSDDVWHADKLEKQIKCLRETGADVVVCRMSINGDKKNVMPKRLPDGFVSRSTLPFDIGTQTLLAKAIVFKIERFDERMPRLQDFELLIRIQKKHTIYCMDSTFVDYYVQDNSISANPTKFLSAIDKIFEKHHDFLNLYTNYKPLAISCFVVSQVSVNKSERLRLRKYGFNFSRSLDVIIKYFFVKIRLYNVAKKIFK